MTFGMRTLGDVFLFSRISVNCQIGGTISRHTIKILKARFNNIKDLKRETRMAIIDLLLDICELYRRAALIYNDDSNLDRYDLYSMSCAAYTYKLVPYWNGSLSIDFIMLCLRQ